MTATQQQPGAILAERLGIESIGREGHDVRAACISCESSDAMRIHEMSGVGFCHSCQAKWSAFDLCEQLLGSRADAMKLLVELGLRTDNGRHRDNGAAVDPLHRIAQEKRVSVESLKAYGARVDGGSVVFPVYGGDGKQCSEFTLKPGGGKGLFARGKSAGLFLPCDENGVRLPQVGETWLVVEGVKDASALHALKFNAAGLNTSALAVKFARLFRDVHVLIVPDRDQPGEDGAAKTAARLHGVASSVHIVTLPGEFRAKCGIDVRDVLQMKDGETLLRSAIGDAKLWAPPTDSESDEQSKDRIAVGLDETRCIDEAIESLGKSPEIFQRGGSLVHIVRDAKPPKGIKRPADSPRIVPVKLPRIRDLLSEVATFTRLTEKGESKGVRAPDWLVKGIEARGQWEHVRPIQAVVEVPILRSDGSVIQSLGYDAATGVFYEPQIKFPPIPDQPTKTEALACRNMLLEVIVDFPFSKPEHQAAWFASLLTPFARQAFVGPAPMFMVDANVRGCGKTLVTGVVSTIYLGRDFARMTAPTNDEETRKRITSIAIAGELLVLIDNVAGTLGSPSLDAALTSTVWSDRKLGGNEMTGAIPLDTIWFATGNNIVLGPDTARRVVHVRLESREESPEERSGFAHGDLLEWVRSERGRLAIAVVTILRAYFAAGCPDMKLKPWGSFEGWSNLVRQAVVWVELSDPGETRKELVTQSDREAGLLKQLIEGWHEIDPEGDGLTVSAAFKVLDGHPNHYDTLRNALLEFSSAKGGKLPSPRSVGMKLHHLRQRVIGGKCFDKRDSNQGAVWSVSDLHRSDSRDTSDSNPLTPMERNKGNNSRAAELDTVTTAPTTSLDLVDEIPF